MVAKMSGKPSCPQTRAMAAMTNVPATQALDSDLAEASVESTLSDAEYSEEALGSDLPLAVTAVDESDLSESDKLLLKAFVKHTPSNEGRFNVVSAIIRCDQAGPGDLEQLASWLRGLLMCVRSSGGETPAIATPSTLQDREFENLVALQDSATLQSQSMLKHASLDRDGGKCVVTGLLDTTRSGDPEDMECARTECCHIMPYSMGSFQEKEVRSVGIVLGALTLSYP